MAIIVGAAGGGVWATGTTWVGGVAPGVNDDAQLTATSGAVSVGSGTNVCKSLDCTGYLSTLSGSSGLSIGGNLTAGGTWSWTGTITFVGSGTITSNGLIVNQNITINGSGITVTVADTLNVPTSNSRTLTITQGMLDLGTFNPTITTRYLVDSGTLARGINFGASTIYCYQFKMNSSVNLTITSGTETIYIETNLVGFWGAGQTYYALVLPSNVAAAINDAGNTFTSVSAVTGSGAGAADITIKGDQTIGTLTITTTDGWRPRCVVSDVIGTPRTLTVGAATLTGVWFRDIVFANSTSPGTSLNPTGVTRVGNLEGNSGDITFTTGVNKFWVGNASGSWSSISAYWATSSGGSGSNANMPLPQDTAIFDAASFNTADRTVTFNYAHISGFNCTAIDVATNFAITTACRCYGSVVLGTNVTLSGTTLIEMANRTTQQNITCNGLTFTNPITINSLTGTVTLVDAFAMASAQFLTLTSGAFDSASQAMSANISASGVTATLDLGGSAVTLPGTGTIWNTAVPTNLTWTEPASITVSDTSANAKTIAGGGLSFGSCALTINNGTNAASTVTIDGNDTFGTITVTGTAKVSLGNSVIAEIACTTFTMPADGKLEWSSSAVGPVGSTLTCSVDFVADASAGHEIYLTSKTPTYHGHLVIAAGTIEVTFCSIKDNEASGGASFIASISNGNIDVSGNSGWNFAATGGGIIPLAMHHYKMLRG